MVTKAEDYSWLSAVAHCGLKEDAILSQKSEWEKQCDQISNWSSWLAEGDDPEKFESRIGKDCG
jgi:hypothetical protein